MDKVWLILCLIVCLFYSCDDEGELLNKDYYPISVNILHSDEPLKVAFLVNGENYLNRLTSEEQGTLRIYKKDSTTLLLDTVLNIKDNWDLNIIQLPGGNVDIYHPQNYISFNVKLILDDKNSIIKINGQKIVEGKNYIRKMDSYLIQYFMPNNSTPIKEEQNTNLIQDGTILFLKVGDVFIKDDGSTPEEAPATENLSKVRIFYGSTNGLNVDAIKVTLFTYPEITIDPIEDLSSFVLKKGELSPYFVIDLARYENTLNEHAAFGFIIKEYDLSTQTEGRVIASGDGSTDFMPDRQSGDPSNPNSYKMKYKFMTYQLFSDYAPQFVMGQEW